LKSLFIGSFFLCIGLALLLSLPRKNDRECYLKLIEESQSEAEETGVHKQIRQGIRKDIYASRPSGRVQAVLTTPNSELQLTKDPGSSEVIEKFGEFQCVIQEELYTKDESGQKVPWTSGSSPEQSVRQISGSSGQFLYQKQLIDASDVMVARYSVPGRTIPVTPSAEYPPEMVGSSQSAELYFGKGFRFRAKELRAQFYTPLQDL